MAVKERSGVRSGGVTGTVAGEGKTEGRKYRMADAALVMCYGASHNYGAHLKALWRGIQKTLTTI